LKWRLPLIISLNPDIAQLWGTPKDIFCINSGTRSIDQ
jgi:hypothetical protein